MTDRRDYYHSLNQQKSFARYLNSDESDFTYSYSTWSEYQTDKSKFHYNVNLKLVETKSSGTHHEDCDEPECGTSNWFCDLCIDLNVSSDEPAGVSEVSTGCEWIGMQCVPLLECDDDMSPLPDMDGTTGHHHSELEPLRTPSPPMFLSDECEPAAALQDTGCEDPLIVLDVIQEVRVATHQSDMSNALSLTPSTAPLRVSHQRVSHLTRSAKIQSPIKRLHGLLYHIFVVFAVASLSIQSAILLISNAIHQANASLLTIASVPKTFTFVFDRGKCMRVVMGSL